MMIYVGIHKNPNSGIWHEFTATKTKQNIIMVKPHEGKCTYTKFYRNIPEYTNT